AAFAFSRRRSRPGRGGVHANVPAARPFLAVALARRRALHGAGQGQAVATTRPAATYSSARTTTDFAGRVALSVPSTSRAPSNGRGRTVSGASKVLCASIASAVRT